MLKPDADRRTELAESFQTNLVTSTKEMNAHDRFDWMLSHLGEYLERWNGLSRFDSVTMRSLLTSDIHAMLIIAINAIDTEFRDVPSLDLIQDKWCRFRSFVRSLRSADDKCVGLELMKRFVDLHDSWVACGLKSGGGKPGKTRH